MAKPRRVGLIYDEKMCRHRTPNSREDHPEKPDRVREIWRSLRASPKNILKRCIVYEGKEAEDKHILMAHSKSHVKLIKHISSKPKTKRKRLASKYDSIYFNEGSSQSAYLAAGSVLHVVEKVASGELNSAAAIVRPPGHHAEFDEPMGFCLFNNVAVATKYILDERPELGVKKILIVDWDVHHGNGTQKMFWDDPRVLVFSVHRHESGSFYPENDDGFYTMTGEGPGAGYNINVPWENGQCGDADYIAAWDHVLLPVTEQFDPDMIIVSAGFDAAVGDPIGGCCVTPLGYSVMLKKLMNFANRKIVLALEGGYNLESTANSMLACVETLLKPDITVAVESLKSNPLESTWRVIKAVRKELCPYWPTLADEGKQFSETEAMAYIQHAFTRPLLVTDSLAVAASSLAPISSSGQSAMALVRAPQSRKKRKGKDYVSSLLILEIRISALESNLKALRSEFSKFKNEMSAIMQAMSGDLENLSGKWDDANETADKIHRALKRMLIFCSDTI